MCYSEFQKWHVFEAKTGFTFLTTRVISVFYLYFSIFDVICSNKVSFHRTEDKTRRIMAKQFERKVIEDARKCGAPIPVTSSRPHYHSAFSNWPKLPPIKYRNNENLRQFHSN